MIKIVEFKKYMQSSAKNFVINIMKEELNINNKDFMKVTEDLENIEEHYINRGGCFLVAYCKRKIIGTIAFTYENNISVLKRFYVSKEYRNKSIGLLLYRKLEDKIRVKKIKNMYLVTGKELKFAHHFYEKNGWVNVHNNPGIFVRDGAIIYQKKMEADNMEKFKILKDLIHFNTINDKENSKIINYIESYLKELGFKTEYKTKVLVMSIGSNPKLGFLGHTDTVEYISDFKNPFDLIEKDGYLYGLGVCDMKGGIAAILEAISEINFKKLKYGLKLYFTYDEEIGFSGIYELLNKKEVYPRLHVIWGAYQ